MTTTSGGSAFAAFNLNGNDGNDTLSVSLQPSGLALPETDSSTALVAAYTVGLADRLSINESGGAGKDTLSVTLGSNVIAPPVSTSVIPIGSLVYIAGKLDVRQSGDHDSDVINTTMNFLTGGSGSTDIEAYGGAQGDVFNVRYGLFATMVIGTASLLGPGPNIILFDGQTGDAPDDKIYLDAGAWAATFPSGGPIKVRNFEHAYHLP